MNPAFEVARLTGNNIAKSFQESKDSSAIEQILSDAMKSGRPEDVQNSIGKILSQVSPERQGAAVQYLQNTYNTIQQKQAQNRQRKAALQAGLNPDLPQDLQKIQYEDNLNNQRVRNILGGAGIGSSPNQQMGGLSAGVSPNQVAGGAQNSTQSPTQNQPPNQAISWKDLTDEQIVQLRGIKGFKEPAEAEQNRRIEDRKATQKENSEIFKFDLNRAGKVLDESAEVSRSIPQKRSALANIKDAILNRDLSFWSYDNLAEMTGLEGLRSPEGALFKTAGKEYFLGSIQRAGARPNQWIEQQISDMLQKIGRSTAANLTVSRALENELDIDQKRVDLTNEISERMRSEGNTSMKGLGQEVDRQLKTYAEEKQNQLYNDLRAISSIDDKRPVSFKKVTGNPTVSEYVVEALLNKFNNDADKAMQEAIKLGYLIDGQ